MSFNLVFSVYQSTIKVGLNNFSQKKKSSLKKPELKFNYKKTPNYNMQNHNQYSITKNPNYDMETSISNEIENIHPNIKKTPN